MIDTVNRPLLFLEHIDVKGRKPMILLFLKVATPFIFSSISFFFVLYEYFRVPVIELEKIVKSISLFFHY